MKSLLLAAIFLLAAFSVFAQRGGGSGGGKGGGGSSGGSHSGSGTGGSRSGASGAGHRGPSSSFNHPGFRSGAHGSGFRYNTYPRRSSGFSFYPGFYSGFGYGFGSPSADSYYSSGVYGSAPLDYDSALQPAPPVVINEYYPPHQIQPRMQDYSNGGYGLEPAPTVTAAPAKKPDFWLLAFPNGTVVLAVAYWTDHGFLYYVTRTKEQKQILISAIDRDLTEQLNQERGLEFHIPK